MTVQPPASADRPAAGAGLPAHAYDALRAQAEKWERLAGELAHWVDHWRERGDERLLGVAEGRVRQAWDCARDLRNLAGDLTEEG
ncbi:hypothetical protein OHR68_09800 [Spirillospora sp. NBC_00431]